MLRVGSMQKYIAIYLLFCILLPGYALKIQAQTSTATLQGRSNDVLLIPNNTVNAGEVRFRSDRDHDGMTDEEEIANGTNPDDAADADGDLDGDGLTNGDEVARRTNLNSADSDGDGISDIVELNLGYDPLDANSTPPPDTALVSLQISPNPLGLVVNPIFGSTPLQLTVTGVTNTGTSVNLTNDANTVYLSLDPSIAAVSSTGSVFGINAGTTTIRVRNGNLTANASANVANFSPVGVSSVQIPGFANNVDVVGNYAFIAAGSAGLQIVDVTDRDDPQRVASYDTNGNANDVRVVGNYAYIADGVAGLQIINVANPLSPTLSGTYNTPGEANDVVIVGTNAYVADGLAGLQIIDVSDPAAPQLIGAVDTPGKTRGVDVSGNFAVLAEGSPSRAVRVVNISDPATPQIVGVSTQNDEVIDLAVRGNFAYIACWFGGLKTIDFSDPAVPFVADSDFNGFAPRDVALSGDFLMAAETTQFNFIPFFNVGNPPLINYRGGIDLSARAFADGTGIAVDSNFVYLTAASFVQFFDKGVDGFSTLFISRYQVPSSDTFGIAPTVELTSPVEETTVKEGRAIRLSANAADDVFVGGVQFRVNGNVVATDSTSPYEFDYIAPLDSTSLTIDAVAFDLGGNTASSSQVTVTVTPDPPPSVSITAPTENATFIEGESIVISADASDDEAVTQVRISADDAEIATLFSPPYETSFVVPSGVNSFTIEAAATDTANRTVTFARTVNVIPDPGTTVNGRVLTASGQPVAGASVSVFDSFTAQTAADGTFSIPNVPTVKGNISVKATALINNLTVSNAGRFFAPVRGGTTSVGDIKLAVGTPLPTAVSTGYFGNRDDNLFFGQDLFVAYNDRLSSVFSFNGTEFVPRAVGQMESGAVTAGVSSSVSTPNAFGDNLTFLQLAGQSGVIDKFNANMRDNITRTNVPTELVGESKYIGLGYDYATGASVVAFLSNDEAGGAVIKLKVADEPLVTVPIPSGDALHSLVLSDVDDNGFTDVLAVKSLSNGAAKLISVKRSPAEVPQQLIDAGIFESAAESDIIERIANPANGLNNLIVGNFDIASGREIAVLGDDRVRIYGVNASGIFEFQQEILIPADEIITGGYAYGLQGSFYSDLLVTTKNTNDPESRKLFVFFNSGDGCPNCGGLTTLKEKNPKPTNSQQLFNLPLSLPYTSANTNGDTRIAVGDWNAPILTTISSQLDVAVIDGGKIFHFPDIGQGTTSDRR